MDSLENRRAVLETRMNEKEKKIERTEKNLAKTRKEQSLILQAANHERMNKGKEKKNEDNDKIMFDSVQRY
jgi:hypothetical protein